MEKWRITSAKDYQLPLLRLMARLRSAQAEDVLRAFEREYGSSIPAQHRTVTDTGRMRWRHYVHWARYNLVKVAFMGSVGHGRWTITQEGEAWLAENPEAAPGDLSAFVNERSLTGVQRAPLPGRRGPGPARDARLARLVPQIDLETLEQTRKAMPSEEFRRLWGALYDQVLAEERAKAITEISSGELGRRARQ